MAFLNIENISITGLSACVPAAVEENTSLTALLQEEADKLIAATGIERRRIASPGICTSDLCYEAAEALLNDLKWERSSVDCLIVVTQTADYILPSTSCILQHRMKLSEECYAFDIALGCSGWVYGLSMIAKLLANGQMKRGLLLAGDISISSRTDKSTYPLFGVAGTATALEFQEGAAGMKFHLATDGSGYKAIIVPDGRCRNPLSSDSFVMKEFEPGIIRSNLNLVLEGMDVFSFATSRVPQTVNKLTEYFTINTEEIDYYIFHQANLFMNEKIRKKLKLPENKVPYSLKNFGNTSSASIPLTMVSEMQDQLQYKSLKHIACGFGVGLSWASVFFETNNISCCNIIEI